jgi:hypothetical protein
MSWSGGTTGGGCDKDESKVNRSGVLYGGFGFGGGGTRGRGECEWFLGGRMGPEVDEWATHCSLGCWRKSFGVEAL